MTSTLTERNRVILALREAGLSQSAIAKRVGLSQPTVKYILDAAAGKPRLRSRTRSEAERKQDRDKARNPTKTVRCSGCGKLCWGRKPDHLCLGCREKANLVHCDNPSCGREYRRRRRNDQPGLHNYCSAACRNADRHRCDVRRCSSAAGAGR
jgi:DNA-binding CsgD family transcriptional regulator